MHAPEGLIAGGVVNGGDLVQLPGSVVKLNEAGANATMGVATLVAGTLLVATTKVTANSRVFISRQLPKGGALGNLSISARVAGVSFTILSDQATDVSDVAWQIVEPV